MELSFRILNVFIEASIDTKKILETHSYIGSLIAKISVERRCSGCEE